MVKDLEYDLKISDKIWTGTDLSKWAQAVKTPTRIPTKGALKDRGSKMACLVGGVCFLPIIRLAWWRLHRLNVTDLP